MRDDRVIAITDDGFEVHAPGVPHHDRRNGGHVVVVPPGGYGYVPDAPSDVIARLMEIGARVDVALTGALRADGIPVVRANYQINGNWAHKKADPAPFVHLHIYLRSAQERHPAGDPRFAAFPDALALPDPGDGYYATFEPLTDADIAAVRRAVLGE